MAEPWASGNHFLSEVAGVLPHLSIHMCLMTGSNIVLIDWHQTRVLEVLKGKKILEKLEYEQDTVASNIGIVVLVQKGKIRISFNVYVNT